MVELGVSDMWCTAIVVFDPVRRKVLSSVVGLGNGEIFSATHGEHRAYVTRPSNEELAVVAPHEFPSRPSGQISVRDATIAFYGQKAASFLSVIRLPRFVQRLEEIARDKNANFRLHTLAGNPVMVKLIDRARDRDGNVAGRGFDAVFDVKGQMLHDCIPGAVIALREGANLIDLDTDEFLTEADLGERLLEPTKKLRYVLAATEELARELSSMLQVDSPELASERSDDVGTSTSAPNKPR